MRRPSHRSLWQLVAPAHSPPHRMLCDAQTRVTLRDLASGTSLEADLDELRGRSVIIATERQLPAALALAELDGIARRIVLCTSDLAQAHLLSAMADAEIDTVVTDGTRPMEGVARHVRVVPCSDQLRTGGGHVERCAETEWVLFTSGTTGRPKLAVHTLSSLTEPISDGLALADSTVWSTFYDVRRYGGLQILLRALAGGGSMILADAGEAVADFLQRVGAAKVTHISGTPSHWRRALMSAAAGRIAPGYVRLSGEACDQAILDNLRQTYPGASIAHAFASTEAGVAFDVRDGRAGFPASLIGLDRDGVQIRVMDGSLRLRSSRAATRYLGNDVPALTDAAGFIDTGDLVELRDDRYSFIGRREGIINVGGLKVHPEAVEAVINRHPAVRMSRVSGRPSPITGAIVVAEVVMNASQVAHGACFAAIRHEIIELCRRTLAPHQVPAMLREVPSLDIAASGKLVRRHA